MKAQAVSALRSERGLRRVIGAEPQVVGLTPQTTNERRANTMKTYLLRAPKPVELQSACRARRAHLNTARVAAGILACRGAGLPARRGNRTQTEALETSQNLRSVHAGSGQQDADLYVRQDAWQIEPTSAATVWRLSAKSAAPWPSSCASRCAPPFPARH